MRDGSFPVMAGLDPAILFVPAATSCGHVPTGVRFQPVAIPGHPTGLCGRRQEDDRIKSGHDGLERFSANSQEFV
jgi:hypothetical protein